MVQLLEKVDAKIKLLGEPLSPLYCLEDVIDFRTLRFFFRIKINFWSRSEKLTENWFLDFQNKSEGKCSRFVQNPSHFVRFLSTLSRHVSEAQSLEHSKSFNFLIMNFTSNTSLDRLHVNHCMNSRF